MTRKLLVRQGGGGASEVDFLAIATPRKGAPWFDKDAPLLQMGQRFANGESAMGYFKIVDPAAALSTTGFRTRPWAEVRLTEDASGDELTLGWMRVTANDASRHAPYTGGDQVEHDPQLMDCNLDLRGIPFEAGWHRDAENEGERLNALESAKLNGGSSLADIHRVTTNITVAAIADGHLADMGDSFDLPITQYPAGSDPWEIINDIAGQAGKIWGVVLHHVGGNTHKCLLYIDAEDLSTYTTDVRISDQLADHDPDDPTAPTFAPHWLMGAGREQNMEGVVSGLVSIYGGIDGEERTVFVETGEDDDDWETWVGVYNDSQSDTLPPAERRANTILNDRKRPYQTHKVSILVSAEQAHLVEAGMAIETKSVVMEPGPNKHAWVWRRVAEKTIEPVADGRYWLHLHLEKPRHTHGFSGGSAQPGSTSPKPAPEPVPDEPGTTLHLWEWTTDILDSIDGVSTAFRRNGTSPVVWPPAEAAFGAGGTYGANSAGFYQTSLLTVTAGTDYVFSTDILWRFDPTFRGLQIYWYSDAPGTVQIGTDDFVVGPGHATDTEYHESITLTAPVGAIRCRIVDPHHFAGIFLDNLAMSTAGTVTPDDDYALPDPGTSPYYARSDDPRFSADDQHLTTRVTERVNNNSGVTLVAGDVVVPDITIDTPSVTRTTSAATSAGPVGIVLEGAADDAEVVVLWSGVATFVNTNGTPADGDYLFTSTTAAAADVSATRAAGAFGRVVRDDGSGETMSVYIWGVPDSSAGGAPTGAAGGDLSGTYPNPSVVDDSHSHTGATLTVNAVGELLISDTPSTPLVFADLIQNEAQDDLVYADL